jgi:hypothetical protein
MDWKLLGILLWFFFSLRAFIGIFRDDFELVGSYILSYWLYWWCTAFSAYFLIGYLMGRF